MKKSSHVIRDPIHGLIELSRKEISVINTKVFQRLRRIRQLAMAFLLYPGALHTRFDHSIGVMHIAQRICERLKQRGEILDEDIERVRLAALLHDIGHGPFSHVSEHLLEQFATEEARNVSPRKKIHEHITVGVLKYDSEIRTVLTPEERDSVIEMIERQPTRDFRRDIISSDLDADKMDYLLRDSYFAGVKYGMYDLEKIVDSCQTSGDQKESCLAIGDEGIYALEQLLLGKYHMTQQVYLHRVRSIADAMIVRGVQIAIRDGNQELEKLYQYDHTPNFIDNYMQYNDEKLIDILRQCEQKKARGAFQRLYKRELFKMIAEVPLNDVKNPIQKRRLHQAEDEQERNWEQQIAEHLRIDSDDVIVNKIQIQNPNYGSRSYSFNLDAIMIFDGKQNDLRNLSEYEIILARPSLDEADTEIVQVYAPRDQWNTLPSEERHHEQAQLESEVQAILLSSRT